MSEKEPETLEIQLKIGNIFYEGKLYKQRPMSKAPVPKEVSRIEDVAYEFDEETRKLLTFEDQGNFIVIKPRQYVGSELFSKVASKVRADLGGEYISAGKESHFRVPKVKKP